MAATCGALRRPVSFLAIAWVEPPELGPGEPIAGAGNSEQEERGRQRGGEQNGH
jgi:hypothetical protein